MIGQYSGGWSVWDYSDRVVRYCKWFSKKEYVEMRKVKCKWYVKIKEKGMSWIVKNCNVKEIVMFM